MKKIILTLLVLSSVVFASTYKVDLSHSKIGFKIKHLAISNVYGSFDNFDATINYDEKSRTLTKLESIVDAKSINTKNGKRDKHLRSDDFFDVAKFPDIKFQLLSILGDELTANLTIKGITKKVTFEYENNGIIKDPWGNTKLGFSFEGKIKRKDFNITWNKTLDAGSFVLGEKVKITVDIEAKKID